MVDYNLISTLDDVEGGIDEEVMRLFGDAGAADSAISTIVDKQTSTDDLVPGTILKGRIIGRAGDDVVEIVGRSLSLQARAGPAGRSVRRCGHGLRAAPVAAP